MINKLKEIAAGWVNLAWDQLDMLDEDTKKEGERRAKICDGCQLRVSNSCDTTQAGEATVDFIYNGGSEPEKREKGTYYTGCGCNLRAKVVSPTSQCPLGKWEHMSTFIGEDGMRFTIMHLPLLNIDKDATDRTDDSK